MRILTFNFETTLAFSEPVRNHDFVLRCMPATTPTQQVLSAHLLTDPRVNLNTQVDGFGNVLRVGRVAGEHERFNFFVSGVVMVDQASAAPEAPHPMYLLPSVYAAADDAIAQFATQAIAGVGDDVYEQAEALMQAVHAHFEYTPGATDTTTTAAAAFAGARGVCQDYAHVLIAACRSAGIPARYVNGLMEGEGATHAWVQFNDGNGWHGIDPTNNRLNDDGYLQFSIGRDFSDCPIERGVMSGNAEQTQTVSASMGADSDPLQRLGTQGQ